MNGSGNVIVAMGLQGVLVGTPDGQWSRVARRSPTLQLTFHSSSKASAVAVKYQRLGNHDMYFAIDDITLLYCRGIG